MEQIRLDLIPGKNPPTCHASQYDVGRTIRLNLVEGGSEYSIPAGTTAEIHIRKPDNNIVSASVTAAEGNKYIDIVTAEQWTACAGVNLCEIELKNGANVIGTINFILEVEMDPIDGGSASESEIYNIQALVDTALATSSLVNLPIHLVEGTTTDADLAQALLDAYDNNQDILGYATIDNFPVYCRNTSASKNQYMVVTYLLTGVVGNKVYTFTVEASPYGQITISKTVEEKGEFTIHIVESTMTESADDILTALSDGKELQVIYKPDANSLTTHILPLTLDSGARPDGIRALAFASFWDSKLYAADIVLDSVHSTVSSVSTINGKDLDETGDFPIHINNFTITETAGEVIDAMADGLKPYVIWTNSSQNNYTFTYVLAAVWRPDANTETLIFGCPITGAVRTIHVFIDPTARTYRSSIQIEDYNIPQIVDNSTSSSSVWSSQKTAGELAGKAEIDDTAVSSSTAWSSERIVSLLPTESASGAVASFETPLTLPLVSHNVTIEPVQEGTGDPSQSNVRPISGWSAVNVTRTGVNLNDGLIEEGMIDLTNGTGRTQSGYLRSKNYLHIKGGVNYYGKADGNPPSFVMCFYDKNLKYIGYLATSSVRNTVFTAPSEAYFFRYYHSGGDYRISINYPSTDTDYHAYTGTTYTVDLDDTTYAGELDVTSGVLKVTHKSIVLDGSEGWGNLTQDHFALLTLEDNYTRNTTANLCDNFKIQGIVEWANVENLCVGFLISSSSTLNTIALRNDDWQTTQDLKDWLSSNNTRLVYELATPVEVTLTPEQINTLKGVNNIWADTGDTAVEFKQDIQTYIDSRLSSGTRTLSLAKAPVETKEETKQEGGEPSER